MRRLLQAGLRNDAIFFALVRALTNHTLVEIASGKTLAMTPFSTFFFHCDPESIREKQSLLALCPGLSERL
jgi:hypothetical protein